jgi:hypothetical protein
MLKQIHSATHPAAQLKRGSDAPVDAVESAQAVPGQMWPGVPASTAEALFSALEAEAEEEEE